MATYQWSSSQSFCLSASHIRNQKNIQCSHTWCNPVLISRNHFSLAAAQSSTTATITAVSPSWKHIIITTDIVYWMHYYNHDLVAENNSAKFKAQDKTGGMGERKRRESSQPAWDGNHFKDTERHWRSVPRCVRGVWKAEMAAVWVPAKATSGRNVGKIWFFHTAISRGWRQNGKNKKEDEKTEGLH